MPSASSFSRLPAERLRSLVVTPREHPRPALNMSADMSANMSAMGLNVSYSIMQEDDTMAAAGGAYGGGYGGGGGGGLGLGQSLNQSSVHSIHSIHSIHSQASSHTYGGRLTPPIISMTTLPPTGSTPSSQGRHGGRNPNVSLIEMPMPSIDINNINNVGGVGGVGGVGAPKVMVPTPKPRPMDGGGAAAVAAAAAAGVALPPAPDVTARAARPGPAGEGRGRGAAGAAGGGAAGAAGGGGGGGGGVRAGATATADGEEEAASASPARRKPGAGPGAARRGTKFQSAKAQEAMDTLYRSGTPVALAGLRWNIQKLARTHDSAIRQMEEEQRITIEKLEGEHGVRGKGAGPG